MPAPEADCSRGFSLIELLFALIVASIAILLVSGQVVFVSKKQKEIQSVSDVADTGGYGVRFTIQIEYAAPSAYFSHLPVPVHCRDSSSPCLRKFDQDQKTFISESNLFKDLSYIPSVQFYRDDIGAISSNSKEIYKAKTTETYYSKSLDLTRAEGEIYTTWPLVNDQSRPFVVMHTQGFSAVFSFDPVLASSKTSSDYVVMTGKSFDPKEISQYTNQLVVIYNDRNIRHFVVQKIVDIQSCQNTGSLCQSLVPKDFQINKDHYAIKFKKLKKADFDDFPMSTDPSSWRGGSDISLFPTAFVTLYDATSSDLNTDPDIRKWAHYNHTVNMPGALIALPIKLTAYYFSKTNKDQTHDLISTTYGAKAPSMTEIQRVQGTVIFARRLGTNKINVYVSED